jgi:hypothetical protein
MPQKAAPLAGGWHLRYGPGPDSCTAKRALLLDHAITLLCAYTTGSGLMNSTHTKPMTNTNSTTTAGQAFSASAPC